LPEILQQKSITLIVTNSPNETFECSMVSDYICEKKRQLSIIHKNRKCL